MITIIRSELLKHRRSGITWGTFLAFALGPIMGAIIMLILRNPAGARTGALHAKATAMSFSADWPSYLSLLTQVVGVGGIMVFGFVASWIFGREYAQGTAKDLLALPVSRSRILHAKFAVYLLWCVALVIGNLVTGMILGSLIGLEGMQTVAMVHYVTEYAVTSVLVIAVGTPLAFFALWGRGFITPLAAVALTLVLAQIMGAVGLGTYFPYAVPGIYAGSSGEYKALLNIWSYLLVVIWALLGYIFTLVWWNMADQGN